jgi:hypothetical protein
MPLYDVDRYEGNYPAGAENHFWVAARNAIILNLLTQHGMAREKLLDVGCGRGIVVQYLRSRGVDCRGCEPSRPRVPADLRPFISVGFEVDQLEASARDSVQGLLVLDVIEHIVDVPVFLTHLAHVFPRVQHLLVTVPAQQELWSNWDEYYGHQRRYTQESLAQVMHESGFKVVHIGHFFHSLYLPMRWMSLLGWQRSTQLKPLRFPRIHAFLAAYFRTEFKVIPPGVIGTSLAVVAIPNSPR